MFENNRGQSLITRIINGMREQYHCTNRDTTGFHDYTVDLFLDLELPRRDRSKEHEEIFV